MGHICVGATGCQRTAYRVCSRTACWYQGKLNKGDTFWNMSTGKKIKVRRPRSPRVLLISRRPIRRPVDSPPLAARSSSKATARVVARGPSSPPRVVLSLAFMMARNKCAKGTHALLFVFVLCPRRFCFRREKKVPRIVRMHSDEMEELDSAEAGEILAMFGVDCSSGDTFTDGKVKYSMESMCVGSLRVGGCVPSTRGCDFNRSLTCRPLCTRR